MKVLITGLAGFVGSHLLEHIFKNTDWEVVALDRINSAGNLNRLTDIECWNEHKHRVKFVYHDLRAPINKSVASHIGEVDVVIHMAAQSDVDHSIEQPLECAYDNVIGTYNMLDFAKTLKNLQLFVYFSTDEVYGPAPQSVNYKEGDRMNPGNPYAATKGGAELACRAYANTYKLPIIITNTMNIIGQRQAPTKFLPKVIKSCLSGEKMTIHANKDRSKAGSRFYIHARNLAYALCELIKKNPETLDTYDASRGQYNIVGEKEVDNLTFAKLIAKYVGQPLNYEMVDFHSTRPGHDLRYALDGTKLREMGIVYPVTFEESVRKIVEWTLERKQWLN